MTSPVGSRYLVAVALVAAGLLLSLLTFEHGQTGLLSRLMAAPSDRRPLGGIIRPASETTIAVDSRMRIEEVLVEPGQTVRGGQALFVVDDPTARMALPSARLEVEDSLLEVRTLELELGPLARETATLARQVTALSAQLDVASRAAAAVPNPQARASRARAQAAYDLAALRLRRVRQLHADHVAAQQELEDAEIAMRVAADDLATAMRADDAHGEAAKAESTRAGLHTRYVAMQEDRAGRQRAADLARARVRHQQAVARLTALEERVARSRIDAPAAGTVSEVHVSRGDIVAPGAVLARMADVDRLVVEVQVASSEVPRLRLGGPAQVSITAAAEMRELGVIRSIEPTPGANGTHRVVVGFTPPPGVVLSGQAASVAFPPAP